MKETKTTYAYLIEHMTEPSFDKVRSIACDFVAKLPAELRDELHEELKRGVVVLDSEPALHMYLYSFGLMHIAKLKYAFDKAKEHISRYKSDVEIVDYGCGQGLATICYHDFLIAEGIAQNVKRITLIEPSTMALSRAELLCSRFFPHAEVLAINKSFDSIISNEIATSEKHPTIHLFSNILDVEAYSIEKFASFVRDISKGDNEYIIVSPFQNTPRQGRLKTFAHSIGQELYHEEYLDKFQLDKEKEWTCSLLLCTSRNVQEGIFINFDEIYKQAKRVLSGENTDSSRFYDIFIKLQIGAQYGHKECQNGLGFFYANGWGIEKNKELAFKFYSESAQQGFIPAMWNVALSFEKGTGVSKDLHKMFEWYSKAANNGDSKSMYEVAKCYYRGYGIKKDYSAAFRYFNLAAEHGNSKALTIVGECYLNGIGVEKNIKMAIISFTKAGEQKEVNAIKQLIKLFKERCGIEHFNDAQYDLFVKAVEMDVDGISVITESWLNKDSGHSDSNGVVYDNGNRRILWS